MLDAESGQLGRERLPATREALDGWATRWAGKLEAVAFAKEMLPEAWLPPAEIQYLRERTRLRHALAQDRNRWAQRLHAPAHPRGLALRPRPAV